MTDNECRELLRLSENFEYEIKMNFVESVMNEAKSIGIRVLSFMIEGDDIISFRFAGNLRIGQSFIDTLADWAYIKKAEMRNGDICFVRCYFCVPSGEKIRSEKENIKNWYAFQFFPQRIKNAVEWEIHRKQRREKIYSVWKKKRDVFYESCGCSSFWELPSEQMDKVAVIEKKVEYWRLECEK